MATQPRRMNFQEFIEQTIQKDPRTQALRVKYQGLEQAKKVELISIQHIEADIIKNMGGYEAVYEGEKKEDLQEIVKNAFYPLIKAKKEKIEKIQKLEQEMYNIEQGYQKLANSIVEEIKKMTYIAPQSAESCPESAPCDCKNGSCDNCTCTPHVVDASEVTPEAPTAENTNVRE